MSKVPFRLNKNGFAVATVHYSLDPAKDDKWREIERQGMPEWSWRKEYEMDPYAFSGKPAFPELPLWEKHIHIPLAKVVKGAEIPDWWPRYAGFDWGRKNPSAFELATVTPDGVLIFYWELYRPELKPDQLNRIVRAHPDWDKIEYIAHDPSMMTMTAWGGGVRSGDEERALADVFTEFGWPMVPGIRGDDVTFTQELYKAWKDLDHPRIIVTHACPNLWNELKGLRHEELNTISISRKNDPEKLVDKDNHAFDAVKYLIRLNPSPPNLQDHREHLTNEQRAWLPNKKERGPVDPVLGDYY